MVLAMLLAVMQIDGDLKKLATTIGTIFPNSVTSNEAMYLVLGSLRKLMHSKAREKSVYCCPK